MSCDACAVSGSKRGDEAGEDGGDPTGKPPRIAREQEPAPARRIRSGAVTCSRPRRRALPAPPRGPAVAAHRRRLPARPRRARSLPRRTGRRTRRSRSSSAGSPRCARTGSRRRRSHGASPRCVRTSATSSLSARETRIPLPRFSYRGAPRTLPRALSPSETERLIDAATGTTPRSLRDRALVELLYGAGLRVSEAVGLEKSGVALEERVVRVLGKGGKERLVPLGRPAAEAVRRYLALGRPHLDRRYRPELFLNARGGALTRAGAFLILRKLADEGRARAGARASPPPPPLVRHAPARGRRRPPLRAGDARPRRPRDDRALHARLRPPTARGLLPGAPARAPARTPRQGAS